MRAAFEPPTQALPPQVSSPWALLCLTLWLAEECSLVSCHSLLLLHAYAFQQQSQAGLPSSPV